MERTNIDNVVDLFEQTEEEKYHLSEFSWKGSSTAGTLKTGTIGI